MIPITDLIIGALLIIHVASFKAFLSPINIENISLKQILEGRYNIGRYLKSMLVYRNIGKISYCVHVLN